MTLHALQPGFSQSSRRHAPTASRLMRLFRKKSLDMFRFLLGSPFRIFGQTMHSQKVLQDCECGSIAANIKFYTFEH
jgi:hypothetical protein